MALLPVSTTSVISEFFASSTTGVNNSTNLSQAPSLTFHFSAPCLPNKTISFLKLIIRTNGEFNLLAMSMHSFNFSMWWVYVLSPMFVSWTPIPAKLWRDMQDTSISYFFNNSSILSISDLSKSPTSLSQIY